MSACAVPANAIANEKATPHCSFVSDIVFLPPVPLIELREVVFSPVAERAILYPDQADILR
jgi:hypothetical protein